MSASPRFAYGMTLIASCGVAASSIGVFTNSVGVFYAPVSASLGVGRGAFALHATLCSLAAGLFSPLAARLMRRYSLRLLLLIGVGLACGATALMACVSSVYWFYALGILRGVGMAAFSLMPVTTVIGNWFQARYGLAMGAALSFSGLSGAVFSPLFSRMIISVGWRGAFLFMALVGLLLALPGVFFLRLHPREVGLPPYGGALADRAPVARNTATAPAKPYLPAFVILSAVALLHTSVTGVAQHFPGLAETTGLGAQVGAAMVSAGMIGNIASKLAIGALSDRIGPFRSSMCMILLNGVSLAALLFAPPGLPYLALAAAFVYGTVYSVGAVGISLMTRAMFGVESYARVYSRITLFTSFGSAVALTIIGLVYDYTGGYTAALVGCVAIDVFNLAALAFLRKMRRTAA